MVLTLCCGLGVLGIVPIVLGVKARAEIRATGGQQEGDGMALAGIIPGAVAVVLSVVCHRRHRDRPRHRATAASRNSGGTSV